MAFADDELKSKQTGSTDMRTGSSSPGLSSPKFTGSNVDVNVANGGSQSLGPRSRTKSDDALRKMWNTTSPPTSPRSPSPPTHASAPPKLDVPLSLSSPRAGGTGGEEENDTDEFGSLIFSQELGRVTLLSDEKISSKSLSPKDLIGLVQAASTVINAQGILTIATPLD